MSAELDYTPENEVRLAYAGKVPWHSAGNKTDPTATPKEWQRAAHLDWTVERIAVMAQDPMNMRFNLPMPNHRALMRSDDKQILGTCSAKWIPTQNDRIFEFFQKIIDRTDGAIQMNTAGSVKAGQWVWGCAKVVKSIDMGKGESIDPYVLFYIPHTVGETIKIMRTGVRPVCWNTLSYNIQSGGILTHRHVSELDVDRAVETYMQLDADFHEWVNKAKGWMNIQVPEDTFTYLTWRSFRPQEVFEIDARGKLKAWGEDRRHSALQDLYQGSGLGARMDSTKGTAWGAYNAVTEFIDHHSRYRTPETRFQSIVTGNNARIRGRMEHEITRYANDLANADLEQSVN